MSGLVGPWFDPDEAAALLEKGLVADGRAQKYLGSSNGCPIRAEPTAFPAFVIRLPFAWNGNTAWAMPVTSSG
jgi:hypothetical protein